MTAATADQPAAAPAAALPPAATGIRGAFSDPCTRWLLLSCFTFVTAFMWMQFLAAWTVEHITHSTRLVQFTGL